MYKSPVFNVPFQNFVVFEKKFYIFAVFSYIVYCVAWPISNSLAKNIAGLLNEQDYRESTVYYRVIVNDG